MLKIINDLKPFFEDCYKEINVRGYARLKNISAPTASTILKMYFKEGLLKKKEDKGYLLFRANRESKILKDLSRIYWYTKLNKYFENFKTIILFGSLSKLESNKNSDIDIFLSPKKNLDIHKIEKILKRNIQLFSYNSVNEIKNDELKKNILSGYILKGRI